MSWLLPAALLILWDGVLRAGWILSFVLPAPASVWDAAAGLIASGALYENLAASTLRAASGFLIGAGAGFSLALLTGLSPLWGHLLNPFCSRCARSRRSGSCRC